MAVNLNRQANLRAALFFHSMHESIDQSLLDGKLEREEIRLPDPETPEGFDRMAARLTNTGLGGRDALGPSQGGDGRACAHPAHSTEAGCSSDRRYWTGCCSTVSTCLA